MLGVKDVIYCFRTPFPASLVLVDVLLKTYFSALRVRGQVRFSYTVC